MISKIPLYNTGYSRLYKLMLSILLLISINVYSQRTTILPNNGSYSQQAGPQGGSRYQRQFYLVDSTELKASGLRSGMTVNSVGFTIGSAQSDTTKGKFIVYLQNTSDTASRTDTAWTTVTASTNSFYLTNLTAGRYEWQVQSNCAGPASAQVASASFTNDNLTGCNPPTSPTTDNITATSATFRWIAPISAVTKYYVTYRKVNIDEWILDSTTSTSYNAATLTANSLYQWRVWTKCSGDSSSATSATFSTNNINACNAPSNLTNGTSTNVTGSISWSGATGATRYEIQYRRVGAPVWLSAVAFSTNFTISNLVAGTSYEWQVRTVCSTGAGAYVAGPAPFITTGTTQCYAPANAMTDSLTASNAKLVWSAVTGATSYTVRYRQKETISWTNATTPMTKVHDDSLLIPKTTGAYDVDFKGGIPFTYQGAGLYVAFEYSRPIGSLPSINTALGTTQKTMIKGINGQDSLKVILSLGSFGETDLPAVLQSVSQRPETRLGSPALNDSVEVSTVYALGYRTLSYSPAPIATLIKNFTNSTKAIPVTLTVKNQAGTNRYTENQTINIDANSSQVVTFTGWSPTITESDSIIVSVSAITGENVLENNRNFYLQVINTSIQSYADNTGAISSAGFLHSTGLLLNRYTMNGCGKLNAAQIYLTTSAKNQTVYAVALDASGTVIAQSAAITPDSSQVNNYYNFYFPTPALIKNADYYIGLAQTTSGFTPVGVQWENAIVRNNAYYRADLTGANLIDTPQQGRLMIRAEIVTGITPPVITGNLTLCSADPITLQAGSINTRFANNVIAASSQYSNAKYSAVQVLGTPNVYPGYGSSPDAWSSSTADGQREYLVLGFSGAAPVNFIDIYETYNPGAVDTVYVKNPGTGNYDIVYSGADATVSRVSRIKHITFPATTYNVSEVRIAINSPVVSGFNAIDAVTIGQTTSPATFSSYAWTGGGSAQTKNVSTAGLYKLTVTDVNGCEASDSVAVVTPANVTPSISVVGSIPFCPGDSVILKSNQKVGNTWSTTATADSIIVKTAGSYTVSYNNGCASTTSAATTVTLNTLPTVSVTPQTASLCPGGSVTLDGGSGFNSYLWSTGAATQTASITNTGSYNVTVTDANGCKATGTATITASSSLAPTISGNLSFCPGGNTTLDPGAGYNTYSWSNGQHSRTISPSTAGTYTVTVSNSNGCSGSASVTTSLYTPPPLAISGNAGFCPNGSTALSANADYSSYAWTANAATIAAPTVKSIPVNSADTYTLAVTDNHGCSASRSVAVIQFTPPSPTISGSLSFCGGNSTTLDAGPGYSTYSWSTGATTQTISVTTVNTFTVTVTDSRGCTGSASATTTNQNTIPATPGSISGATFNVCNSTQTYTIAAVPNATRYNWTAPAGATITSGQGTTSVNVSFGAGFTSGDMVVAAANSCGQSSSLNARTLTVKGPPDTPGSITGTPTGVCGKTNVYSITAVTGAATYTWGVPPNATITNGQGTTNITVAFASAFTAGNIMVTANNSCGSSAASSLAVSSKPIMSGSITGPASVCAKLTGVTYSIPAATGANSYTWTVPSLATIKSGQGTRSITVDFSSKGGNVSVTATNACGTTTAQTLAVVVSTCSKQRVIEPTEIVGADVISPDRTIQAYPNPTKGLVTVYVTGMPAGNYQLSVYDAFGRTVLKGKIMIQQNHAQVDLSKYAKGFYTIQLSDGLKSTAFKVIVQ